MHDISYGFISTEENIVYKVAITPDSRPALIELKLPASSLRIEFESLWQTKRGHYSFHRAGRASSVEVNDIWLLDLDLLADDPYALQEAQNVPLAVAAFDFETVYQKGDHVTADAFDMSPVLRCSNGIHYFRDKNVAICFAAYDEWFRGRIRDHIWKRLEMGKLWQNPKESS